MTSDFFLRRCFVILAIVISTVAASVAACNAAPEFVWDKAGENPALFSNAAVVSDGSSIYVIGGNNAKEAICDCWQYTPVTRQWKKLPPLPGGRMCHGAAIAQGRIIVFGGQTGTLDRPEFVRRIDAYDLKSGIWMDSGKMPFSRTRFACAPVQGKIFIFGGLNENNHSVADVQAYNPEKMTWEKRRNLPAPRNRHSAIQVDNGVLVCGGENQQGKAVRSACMYMPSEDRWIEKTPMKTARKNFASARLGRFVIAAGGWDQAQKGSRFTGTSEIYNPATNSWKDTGPLQRPRDGARACAFKGALYLIGGYDGEFCRNTEIGRFMTAKSAWKENRELRVHLATYYHDESALNDSNSKIMKEIDYGNDGRPDITNIVLKNIRALGFPLPARDKSENYTYYLKFYRYPSTLSALLSVSRCVDSLLLFNTATGRKLIKVLPMKDEVFIKKGFIAKTGTVFSQESPYPPQRILNGPAVINGKEVTPQDYFDNHIPFSSIYVKPTADSTAMTDDEKAKDSAGGVVAFHDEILSIYRMTYIEVKGPEDSKIYFIDDEPLQYSDGSCCGLTVIRVLKEPMVFSNWRPNVMPNPPEGMFLTGLLLIYKDIYSMTGGIEKKYQPGFNDIVKHGVKTDAHVFEVGSVVRIKK